MVYRCDSCVTIYQRMREKWGDLLLLSRRPDFSGARRNIQASRSLVGPCRWGSDRRWADVAWAERGALR
jgi:hypothetical protein